MAHPRFDGLDRDRQEQILAAAATEFAARGYGGASVNRIVEGAGLSKGVLYYYFEDKEDVFVTVVERAVSRLLEGMWMPGGVEGVERYLESLPAEGYWAAQRAMAREQVRLMRSPSWYAKLARAFPRLREEPGARLAMAGVVDQGRRLVRALVRRGRETGVVRRDVPEGLLVECYLALDEAVDRWLVERLDAVEEGGLEGLVDARAELIRDLLDVRHEGWEK
jgi:AcrR family transcriptional regulator